MARYDVVIRNGTILDGSGGEPRTGDVAVSGSAIARVGNVPESGREEVDARGCLVTPGFVDVHTHYDGQLTWESRAAPSTWHGVTTLVMGNCGVGFAPCRPDHRATLIRLMEGVEDIPGAALAEGLPWTWESFPEFLRAVARLPHDVDVAAMVPHAALRVYVMGERGVKREPATEADIREMSRLLEESLTAGALGFSTSRTVLHRTADGDFTPMLGAAAQELLGIGTAFERTGRGVFQMVSDFMEQDGEFGILEELSRRYRRPASFSLVQNDFMPHQWRELLQRLERASLEGLELRAQVLTRPIGLILGFEASLHPFMSHPSYKAVAALPIAERAMKLRDPELRARLFSEEPAEFHPFFALMGRRYDRYFPIGERCNYEPDATESVAALAERSGQNPRDVLLDALLDDGGRGLVYVPFLNFTQGDLATTRQMMLHPRTIFGLGDGGAHVGTICDGSAPTTTLTHWGRDRKDGRLPLPWLVRFLTREPAEAVGFLDRGLVAEGLKADLNVIDFDALSVARPELHWDLPAGGRRFLQRASGYRMTLLSGKITYRDGAPTDALPGVLLASGAN